MKLVESPKRAKGERANKDIPQSRLEKARPKSYLDDDSLDSIPVYKPKKRADVDHYYANRGNDYLRTPDQGYMMP